MPLSNINDRLFFACQAVLTKSRYSSSSGGSAAPTDSTVLQGVQSVGVSREISANPFADTGRFQQEYKSFGKTVFTITISRVISKDQDLFFNVNSQSTYENAHILNATNGIGYGGLNDNLKNYDITLLYSGDDASYVGVQSGANTVSNKTFRCCLLTNIGYTISVGGAVTENLTFVTNNFTINDANDTASFSNLNFTHEGDTVQRKDIDNTLCVFPSEVETMFNLGNAVDGQTVYGIQQIEINVEIGYRDIPDIGLWRGSYTGASNSESHGDLAEQNLYKQVELPVGVSCTFQGVLRDHFQQAGDAHRVTDVYYSAANGDDTPADQVDIYKANREIKIVAQADGANYFQWNLGKKNYLTAMDISGGDAGGGNVEATVSFQNDHSEVFFLKNSIIRDFSTTSIY
jgi:hypothetical protein